VLQDDEVSLFIRFSLVFSTANSYWQLLGNTIVTDRYIRLTSDSQSKAGGLWSSIPVAYPDWEMHVHFKVHGTGRELFGDGFAIWYVRDPRVLGKFEVLWWQRMIDQCIDFRSRLRLSGSFSWPSHLHGHIF
jgi:hypothetical protein